MAAHGFDAKSRFLALSWSSTDMYGFNCPSMLQVFQVAEASRRTSPLCKSRGCVVSAIVSSISHPGAISFKESINASATDSVWPLVEANTMCRRNPLLVKFGTRPPGLSIRYPLRLTSSSRRFLPPLWRAYPKTHIRWAEARAQASHRKARVALDRATPSSSSSEIRPEPRSAVQFDPVHKLRGS